MELDVAVSRGCTKCQREDELLRNPLKHQSGIVRKPEAGVESRFANKYAAVCSDFSEFGKPSLHQGSPDATALAFGCDRNRAKSIPADGTVTDGYGRERDMSHDAAKVFGNE